MFKIKSTAARIILTIVIVLVAIIVLLFGLVVFGISRFGRTIENVVEEQTQTDQQKQEALIPRVKDTDNKKEVFEANEIVVGNGVELEILNTYLVEDNTESEFVDNKEYCAIDFKLKNTHQDTQSIFRSNFEMKEPDGTMVPTAFFSDSELITKFNSFTTELESTKEMQKSVAFDCVEITEPLTFEYTGGSLLGFSFFNETEFQPIRFNISF